MRRPCFQVALAFSSNFTAGTVHSHRHYFLSSSCFADNHSLDKGELKVISSSLSEGNICLQPTQVADVADIRSHQSLLCDTKIYFFLFLCLQIFIYIHRHCIVIQRYDFFFLASQDALEVMFVRD